MLCETSVSISPQPNAGSTSHKHQTNLEYGYVEAHKKELQREMDNMRLKEDIVWLFPFSSLVRRVTSAFLFEVTSTKVMFS